jgi:hypothetical protein
LSRRRALGTISTWITSRWTGTLRKTRTTMTTKPTPEERKEIRRLLVEIRSDLAEIRRIFEKIQARLETRSS